MTNNRESVGNEEDVAVADFAVPAGGKYLYVPPAYEK